MVHPALVLLPKYAKDIPQHLSARDVEFVAHLLRERPGASTVKDRRCDSGLEQSQATAAVIIFTRKFLFRSSKPRPTCCNSVLELCLVAVEELKLSSQVLFRRVLAHDFKALAADDNRGAAS